MTRNWYSHPKAMSSKLKCEKKIHKKGHKETIRSAERVALSHKRSTVENQKAQIALSNMRILDKAKFN